MTVDYFLPLLWGLVLLGSFIGYGALLRRLLFDRERLGWASDAAWGMSFIVVLGGLLNGVHVISPPLVLGLIAGGFAAALFDMVKNSPSWAGKIALIRTYAAGHPAAFAGKSLGYACIITLAGLQYVASVDVSPHAAMSDYYSLMDDVKGYFTFPKQMLETGTIAPDAFSGYRLITGLGGQAMLHTLMLVLFDFKHVPFVDGGVALIICVGLVLRIGQERGLAYPWTWALAMFFLIVPYYPALRINSSSFTTGMVMFLALFAFLGGDTPLKGSPVRNAIIVALLAAGGCALKTNLIPPLVAVLGLSYSWYVISTRLKKEALIEAFLVPVFVLLMLLPWMLSLERSSGTMLYPVLGMGFDEYRYGYYLSEDYAGGLMLIEKLSIIFGSFLSREIYMCLFIGGAVSYFISDLRQRAAPQAFALGSLIAAVAIMLRADLSNLVPFQRYLFVAVFTSLVAVLADLMLILSRRIPAVHPAALLRNAAPQISRTKAIAALLAILGTWAALLWHYPYGRLAWSMYRDLYAQIAGSMESRGSVMFTEADFLRHKRAQESVPPGQALLSRDHATLLYDYGRNPIFHISDPGTCSPPPGMPFFQGPDAVAAYLLLHNIRYVAYAYADQAGYPVIDNLWRLRPDRPYSHRVAERAKVALDRVLGELGASRQRLYDDGALFIIDLNTPAAAPAVYREPNYFQVGKILILAWARTQGFGKNKVWTNGHGIVEDIRYLREPGDDLLVLNTFGYHPWKGDMEKLNLVLSVNGSPLPFLGYSDNAYFFSLASVRDPITRITIDTTTFVPREEGIDLDEMDEERTLGIAVDSIEVAGIERGMREMSEPKE
jgi:hypothetical protein